MSGDDNSPQLARKSINVKFFIICFICPTFFVLNLRSNFIAIKNSPSQIFRKISKG